MEQTASNTENSKTEIWQFGVNKIAQMIKKKEISCEETVVSHLERIEEVNSKVNAVSVVLNESAIESAREADRRHSTDGYSPPLLGVPMTGHRIADLGDARSMAEFTVPIVLAPYVLVLRRGLRRLKLVAESKQ